MQSTIHSKTDTYHMEVSICEPIQSNPQCLGTRYMAQNTHKKISMNKMGDPKIASVHQGTLNPAVLVMFSKKDVLFCRKDARSSSFSSNSDWQSTPPSHWSVPESALTVLVRFAFPSRRSLSKVFVTCQNKNNLVQNFQTWSQQRYKIICASFKSLCGQWFCH